MKRVLKYSVTRKNIIASDYNKLATAIYNATYRKGIFLND